MTVWLGMGPIVGGLLAALSVPRTMPQLNQRTKHFRILSPLIHGLAGFALGPKPPGGNTSRRGKAATQVTGDW